jgi:hypothetical protein
MHEITNSDSISVEKFQEFLVHFLVGFESMGELRYIYRRRGDHRLSKLMVIGGVDVKVLD